VMDGVHRSVTLTSDSKPLVTGSPQIRFYAGAPLRTQDGYNIGTLAVMDDAPRDDFTPRQRHTLKEFAVRTHHSDFFQHTYALRRQLL
jgi:GAF domain-containing protein